jgi:hypothetical protein
MRDAHASGTDDETARRRMDARGGYEASTCARKRSECACIYAFMRMYARIGVPRANAPIDIKSEYEREAADALSERPACDARQRYCGSERRASMRMYAPLLHACARCVTYSCCCRVWGRVCGGVRRSVGRWRPRDPDSALAGRPPRRRSTSEASTRTLVAHTQQPTSTLDVAHTHRRRGCGSSDTRTDTIVPLCVRGGGGGTAHPRTHRRTTCAKHFLPHMHEQCVLHISLERLLTSAECAGSRALPVGVDLREGQEARRHPAIARSGRDRGRGGYRGYSACCAAADERARADAGRDSRGD